MEMDKVTGQFWDFFLHKDHDLDENFYTAQLPWRNWLARSTVNRKVGGSSPPGSGVLSNEPETPNRDMCCQGNVHYRPRFSGHFGGTFEIGFDGNIVRSRVGLNHQPFD